MQGTGTELLRLKPPVPFVFVDEEKRIRVMLDFVGLSPIFDRFGPGKTNSSTELSGEPP